jgi:hypothetical protein
MGSEECIGSGGGGKPGFFLKGKATLVLDFGPSFTISVVSLADMRGGGRGNPGGTGGTGRNGRPELAWFGCEDG